MNQITKEEIDFITGLTEDDAKQLMENAVAQAGSWAPRAIYNTLAYKAYKQTAGLMQTYLREYGRPTTLDANLRSGKQLSLENIRFYFYIVKWNNEVRPTNRTFENYVWMNIA